MVKGVERKLGEMWKVQEGSKIWWYVKFPKGVMSFTTKKMAMRWVEQINKDFNSGIIKL